MQQPGDWKFDLAELGTSGLKQFDGFIDEEWHPKLRGEYGIKVYREMSENSSTIGAVRYLLQSLVRQVDWRIEPSIENDTLAQDAAVFVEECLEDMDNTFEDFISEVMSFLDYGWAWFEVVYKLRKGRTKNPKTRSRFDDGKIGWRRFAIRSQDTREKWGFNDDTRELIGLYQQDFYSGQHAFIPLEKSLHFRTSTYKDNPEGRSIYRNAVVDYWYLKRMCEIEAIGIERDMTGLLTMEVPPQMLSSSADAGTKALLNSLKTMLAQLKRDEREYAIVPSELNPDGSSTGFKLKLLSTGGRRQIDTDGVKKFYKINILQSVLAQFVQLGMGDVGSFALASSQTNLFAVALGTYMDMITSTFNKQAIGPLMEYNGIGPEYCPKLVHGDIETPPLSEVANYLMALVQAGQLPEDDAIKKKLLEIGNLPIPDFESQRAADMSPSAPKPVDVADAEEAEEG